MNPELVRLLGGSALLIYSIDQISASVQYLADTRLRSWVNSLAKNHVSALLLGVVLCLLLSSSGAVTVMLVGLANARLLTLEKVFSVTLGASIGTTFIVQLLAFRISEYGLILVAFGVLLLSIAKSDRVRQMARVVLFLGLMYYSMILIRGAGIRLENDPLFKFLVSYFLDRPLTSFVFATVCTALIQSSAAMISFVISIAVAGQGSLTSLVPWILGANLGTTAAAFIAGFRTGDLGKQVAVGHLLVKAAGVALFVPLTSKFTDVVESIAPHDIGRQIAHVHTFFNAFVAIVFFPFISLGVRAVRKLVPEKLKAGPFTFHFIDQRSLSTPELALAQAQREILRLSDTVEQMVDRSIHLFHHGTQRDIEEIKEMDEVVDFLNRGVKLYLTQLSQKEMTPEQVQSEFELLLRTNDLENIGDIVDKSILALVRKSHKKGYQFSKEGWSEIQVFHKKVVECLRVSTAYFNSRDRTLSAKLLVVHEQIEDLNLDLNEQHVHRLHEGVKESLDTTSVHLDLLSSLLHIANLSVNFTRFRPESKK